jgi:hypothetical protein
MMTDTPDAPENTPDDEAKKQEPSPAEATPLPPEKAQAAKTPTTPAGDLPDGAPVADDVQEWEDEDTSEAGKIRSKGALIALAVVLVLLIGTLVAYQLSDPGPLPAAWADRKPQQAKVVEAETMTMDDQPATYYLMEWPGQPQKVLKDVVTMIHPSADLSTLPQVETGTIDQAVRKHRTGDQPGANVPLPDKAETGLYVTYTRTDEIPSPTYAQTAPKRDIYVWQTDGACLVEIFSY